ncbi:S8 family serine peptidase [candidate division KSB1 bacterium]|nr:S8 family serine peptidase [candidate division KSB1 bacterium]
MKSTSAAKSATNTNFGIASLDILNDKYQIEKIETLIDRNCISSAHLKKASGEAYSPINIYKLVSRDRSIDVVQMVADYSKDSNIAYAVPNHIFHTFETIPNEYTDRANLAAVQWALDAIDAPDGWDYGTGSANVIIGIVDTGIDWDHPDLAAKIWINQNEIPGNGIDDDGNSFVDDVHGWDFVSVNSSEVATGEDPGPRDNNPMDFTGHGTHVSGIAGATTNNSYGIAGVAWICMLMAVRAGYKDAEGNGTFTTSDIAAAIYYAADNGANIINMSFGATIIGTLSEDDPGLSAFKDAIDYAYAKDVILIAAAGNDAMKNVTVVPAFFSKVIGVAATDKNNDKATFSNFGSDWIDVAAPGVNIKSTFFNDVFAYMSGTSMSTPLVSGLAALILSKNPDFSNEDIAMVITNEVTAPASEYFVGKGIINAEKALQVDQKTDLVAKITSPENMYVLVTNYIGFYVSIKGAGWALEYGPGIYPQNWTSISGSNSTTDFDGLLTGWSPTAQDNGTYTFRLRVWYGDREIFDRVTINIKQSAFPQQPGWPIQTNGEVHTSPIVADLDNDGNSEIILYVDSGYLYVWDHWGQNKQGWPQYLGSARPSEIYEKQNWLQAMPAIADMDNDGNLDIVVITFSGRVLTFDYLGNKIDDWCIYNSPGFCMGPTIVDLDNDGQNEIIFRSSKNLYAYSKNGVSLSGWVARLRGEGLHVWPSPSVGDIDNDGDYEIVIGALYYYYEDWINEKMYAYHHNAEDVQGWPYESGYGEGYTGWIRSDATLADLDGDGSIEVISGTEKGYILVLNSDGTSFGDGWPQYLPYSFKASPAVGDIDNDGELEIAIGNRSDDEGRLKLYAFEPDGSLIEGWPYIVGGLGGYTFGWISPVMADVNGDNQIDIISVLEIGASLGEGGSEVYAFDKNANVISGFPLSLQEKSYTAVTIADIDGDGDVEILAGDLSGKLFVWNLPHPYNAELSPWGKFKHDNRNTSCFHYSDPSMPVPVELASFNAIINKNVVTLKWRTETESNNYGFEIERALKTDSSEWEKIGFIKGNGTTTNPNHYFYDDHLNNQLLSHLQKNEIYYRLKQIDFDGTAHYSKKISINNNQRRLSFRLYQNYPNPANPATQMRFTLAQACFVSLKVYNVLGKEVETIISEHLEAGEHRIQWQTNQHPSGTYFYKLETPFYSETRKFVLMR